MNDQLLALLIPAITTVLVALIGAVVTVSGRRRDLAVMLALAEKDAQIRDLQAQEEPRASKPRKRHGP